MVAASSKSVLLDQYGQPLRTDRRKVRTELARFMSEAFGPRSAHATYDAAGSGDDTKNYWAPADALDADSANSHAVRSVLVKRSRYEIQNNGYAAGIASTYATDLVGLGPTLRMQTGSEAFNRMVEREWDSWSREIQFRRKLWCMAHAKHVDGEAFGVLRQNKGLRHPVKIDLVLHETEQCTTPWLPYNEPNHIDGIQFDNFGNPQTYEFLKYHPGGNNTGAVNIWQTEQIPARFVLHWFKMLRPGQHRGVPEMVSTMNLGASARRWREAVVGAAENIADFSLFLKTAFDPNEEDIDWTDPMSAQDIQKRMMVALPAGYDAFQPKAEQPTSTHAEFHKTLINEQARPRSMPFNKAACDSSSYNYASGRLDHQTYYGSLDVDREDCDDLTTDRLFDVWFDYAIAEFGWLGGNPETVRGSARMHDWDWPKHQVADIKAEAEADDKRLKNGSTSLDAIYSRGGLDYEDELVKSATANGVTVDQQRQINLLLNVPQHAIQYIAEAIGLSVDTGQPQPTEEGADVPQAA